MKDTNYSNGIETNKKLNPEHVDNLKNISTLEAQGFRGMDASLAESLTAEQFVIGKYRCRYGNALDLNNRPTGEMCVWLWNNHYWQLLVRNCTDIVAAKYSASQDLCHPGN